MSQTEIVVVANGCTDNTKDYLKSLGSKVRYVWKDEPLGYPKAVNLGILASRGEFIILMNNDTVLVDQPKNCWIDLLTAPFLTGNSVGITGPVKFDWNCGGNTYEAMAFWLVMMQRKLFLEVGLLDEIFSPGMGEDGDFCIKTAKRGYKLVSVPHDVKGHFDSGIVNYGFPIWHKGNGTFDDDRNSKNSVIEKNNEILKERYGNKEIEVSIIIPTYNHLDDALRPCLDAVLKYTDLSNKEVIVVANGCTDGTREYLDSLGSKIRYIWFDQPQGVIIPYNAGIDAANGKYTVTLDNDSFLSHQAVDEWINILKKPFLQDPTVGGSSPFAHEYEGIGLLLHTGCTMYRTDVLRQIGKFDTDFHPGYFCDPEISARIWKAGFKCVEVPEYQPNKNYHNGVFAIQFPVVHMGNVQTMDKVKDIEIVKRNRELLYAKHGRSNKPKYSIIIPTYNHCNDLLKPCIESIQKYTNLSNTEIIVVANGCKDNTKEYVESLGKEFKLVWSDEALGYTKATNLGIKHASGEYVVLLNNDTEILQSPTNYWLETLWQPFKDDEKMALTGTLTLFDHDIQKNFIVFCCAMIKKSVFDKIGLLDEIFNPGYGEDIDFTMKVEAAGLTWKCVDNVRWENNTWIGSFPLWHKNNKTFGEISEYGDIVGRNRQTLINRYKNKNHVKYSIIIPTYNRCDELLKPCIDSILEYTDMSQTEIIVVANGCTDNTREYVEGLGEPVKLVWMDEAAGYTRAVNQGIPLVKGEFVIFLNNDTLLLPQQKHQWINMMADMFKDPKMGLVGPLKLHDDYSDHDCIIFFCAMTRKSLLDQIGPLDEIYSPGGGEDIDYSVKTIQAGYKIGEVTSTQYSPEAGTNVGQFPIWHRDNQTFKHIPEYGSYIVKRNGLINTKRYHKNIKLNLGAGGITYPGYLSVDLHDHRAAIMMDITKLDFDDNSVNEILASHVFEHLNPYHSIEILQEWRRVLKPGGKLIMEMPDLEALCKMFVTASTGERYGLTNVIYGSVNTTGVGGPDNITSPHLFGWWPDSIREHLWNAGYVDIKTGAEQIPHPPPNFRVEATKPYDTVINRESLQNQDPAAYNELFIENGYDVKDEEIRNNTVIDIGANIGMFSLLAVERGARRILAFEANSEIYQNNLLKNVKQYPQIEAYNLAGYSHDDYNVFISNKGAESKIEASGLPVKTIRLDTILEKYKVEGDNLCLKLDCEGSEWDILMTTDKQVIRRFAQIYIEVHGNCNHKKEYQDVTILQNYIKSLGYKVEISVPIVAYTNGGHMTPVGHWVEKYARID
jgi:FkbM family methyltransferase